MINTASVHVLAIRPKKKYCLFPISDRPYQNTQIYFMDFENFFFFFLGNP